MNTGISKKDTFNKVDDKILIEGIQKLTSSSKGFEYLKDEEDLYSLLDLKEESK